jgi:DNA-binding response OmpR family regulator
MSHLQGKKKILVVDDETDLTTFCSLALEYHGFKVDIFNVHPAGKVLDSTGTPYISTMVCGYSYG